MIRELASSVVLYHGTSPKHLDSIKRDGLRPGFNINFDESISRKNKVYASSTRETALHWAINAFTLNLSEKGKLNKELSIVKFRVDSSRVKQDRLGGMHSVQVEGAVDPKDIEGVETKKIKDFLVSLDDKKTSYDLKKLKAKL